MDIINLIKSNIEKIINFLNKYIKHLKIFLLLLSLSSIIVYFSPVDTYKEFGTLSWVFLIIVMLVRPLRDIFTKCKLFSFLAKFRREMWILVWVFGIAHTVWYIILMQYKSYFDIFTDSFVWNPKFMLFWWMLAFLVSIPLLLTSNWFFTRILWKNWKRLQYLAYAMFPLVAIHIFMIEKDFWPLIPVIAWIILLVIAHLKNKKIKANISAGPKWFCIPCGYIYDENIWDPDSGIAPGTHFEDIPADWLCPVCGVGKSDFILLDEEIVVNESEIVSLNHLTKDVIELKIDTKKDLDYTSGQFMNFSMDDLEWNFTRSYSIANKEWSVFTFLIKLSLSWRGWKILKTKKVGDKLNYNMISGKFVLKNTTNPKVFIATWTGLAPIYSMILNTPENVSKKLYFWVSSFWDLFYLDNLRKFKNLEIKTCTSKEEIEWCHFWRIDLSNDDFESNTEFYICGNPWVVDTTRKVLADKWFTQVYSEEF